MNKGNLKLLIWVVSILAVVGIGISFYAYRIEEATMGNLAGAILAVVGFIGTIVTLIALIKEKEKPAMQLDVKKLAEMLKEEMSSHDETTEALKTNDLKTNIVSEESNSISKKDIVVIRILSIVGLIIIPLGGGFFSALYGIFSSIICLKKKIKYTQMISSIGLTFFILFLLLSIIAFISKEFITLLILWLLCFPFGIIYSIMLIKALNTVTEEQGYNINEINKQTLSENKKLLIIVIISLCLIFFITGWITFLIGYN